MLATCPAEFFDQVSTVPDAFSRWLAEAYAAGEDAERRAKLRRWVAPLRSHLQVDDSRTADDRGMREKVTRFLSSLGNDQTRLAASARPQAADGTCPLMAPDVLEGLFADWRRADGAAWNVLSDDFLAVLAACPHETVLAFSARPVALGQWLERLPDLSFAGPPEFQRDSDEFRKGLIARLGSSKDHGTAASGRIRSRLLSIRFRVIE